MSEVSRGPSRLSKINCVKFFVSSLRNRKVNILDGWRFFSETGPSFLSGDEFFPETGTLSPKIIYSWRCCSGGGVSNERFLLKGDHASSRQSKKKQHCKGIYDYIAIKITEELELVGFDLAIVIRRVA